MDLDLIDIFPKIINYQDCGIIVLNEQLKTVVVNDWIIKHANLQNKKLLNKNIISLFPQIKDQRLHIVILEALTLNRSSILSQAIHHSPLQLYQETIINGQKTLMQQRVTVKPFSLNQETYCLLQVFDLSAAVAKEYLLRATASKAQLSKEQAESFSNLKNEFINTISHELRTPLTSISGSTALILGGAVGGVSLEVSDMLKIIQRNSDHLLSLINELLDIQKIESGTMHFEYKKSNLIPLINNCLELNKSYAEKFNIKYNFISNNKDYVVYIDEKRISQIILNLLSNATKFSDKNSIITVKIEKKEHTLRTIITDNGPGIPESFKFKIFNKFAQLDSPDNQDKTGSGLGLCICKSIIENHNGEISYYNNIKGASFYFDLPLEKSNYPSNTLN